MQKTALSKLTGSLRKIFRAGEILSEENFYLFIDKKKIIVFVPESFAEKLTREMSGAGAGLIGNYEMCSFRTEGTGTFKPNQKARPFSGKKNLLSYEKEIKLEMECDAENLNKVTDAILKNHPYEETAYEIYDFKKRTRKISGIVVNLKSGVKFSDLLKRLNMLKKFNSKIESEQEHTGSEAFRIAISDSDNGNTLESAKFINCDSMILISQKRCKLFKI